MSDDTLKNLAEILKLLKEEDRLPAIKELSTVLRTTTKDVKVEGNENCHILSFSGDGNNDVRFGGGGWTSRKIGTTAKSKSSDFKPTTGNAYLGDKWVEVYEAVKNATLEWECKNSDGQLIPEHKGTKWNKAGRGLALILASGTDAPPGYYSATSSELRHASGPEGCVLAFRKAVRDKAIELGLIVPVTAESSDVSVVTPDTSVPDTAASLFAGVTDPFK